MTASYRRLLIKPGQAPAHWVGIGQAGSSLAAYSECCKKTFSKFENGERRSSRVYTCDCGKSRRVVDAGVPSLLRMRIRDYDDALDKSVDLKKIARWIEIWTGLANVTVEVDI